MKKTKKRITTLLATMLLCSAFSVSVFAASDTTSNWASAKNSHTRWVGPGRTCSYYVSTNPEAPGNCTEYTVRTKKRNYIVTCLVPGSEDSGYFTGVNDQEHWQGIVQYGKITIIV